MEPKLHTDGTLSALREHAIQNSKKMCVDLSPIKTYNCEWGPNLIRGNACATCRPNFIQMELLRNMPCRSIRFQARRDGEVFGT